MFEHRMNVVKIKLFRETMFNFHLLEPSKLDKAYQLLQVEVISANK